MKEVQCALGHREIFFFAWQESRECLFLFLTSGFAVFILTLVTAKFKQLDNHVLYHFRRSKRQKQFSKMNITNFEEKIPQLDFLKMDYS